MFVGREQEKNQLQKAYESSKSRLVVVYGRRRVGKSSLIQNFIKDKECALSFEAIEKSSMSDQIIQFIDQLIPQVDDSFLSQMEFNKWQQVFRYITEKIVNHERREKQIIFLMNCSGWHQDGLNLCLL